MQPFLPRYDAAALPHVVPSMLAGLGVPGMADTLGLPGSTRVCLLLVDGLGWELLRSHQAQAPFLSSLVAARDPITAGFPATTATSIAALGTGLTPGEHGIVGYTFLVGAGPDGDGPIGGGAVGDGPVDHGPVDDGAVDDGGVLLNALGWRQHTEGRPADLRARVVPEELQPRPTAFEQAAAAGVAAHLVLPRNQDGSGLTRAVLRGGRFRGVHALGDLSSATIDVLHTRDRVFCYSYHADLDTLGHVYGPGSAPWCQQLAVVDHVAAAIAAGLPRGGLLVVTADHGMVTVDPADRVDLDTEPALGAGVRALGGEVRVRHVYTEPGATDDVLATWRTLLGDRAWILRRDEAIAAGWFGPRVTDRVRPRIGDLVVAARGTLGLVRTEGEPHQTNLLGQHGSLTTAEQLVPLLVFHNP